MPQGGYSADREIRVLEGSSFMLSDDRGDVSPGTIQGLYRDDTRHLCKAVLTVAGSPPRVLTARQVDYYSAAFFLTNPELGGLPEQSISIQRSRFIGRGLHEDLVVLNHAPHPVRLEVRLATGADFADLFEVRNGDVAKRGTLRRDHDDEKDWLLRFHYEREEFRVSTIVSFSQRPRFEGDDAVFDLQLDPQERWETCVEVSMHRGDVDLKPVHGHGAFGETEREARQVLEKWREDVPSLSSDWDLLDHVYRRSIVDLAALRLPVEGGGDSLPAAGLPWFMAVFGRDTLIVSYESLFVGPELAAGALHALAAMQGTEVNDFRDEEPGKILHETRHGELTVLEEQPHSPYFGSVDATPLWLILLSEYWRTTADASLARELEPNARAALSWIDEHGDADGDGYVEYRTRSREGLRNQGWKDSWDAVTFADGRLAEPPIALCEVQGYVHDAKVRAAELAEAVWGDAELAARLREEAAALAERFDRDFWLEERGHYAFALDAEKRPVDALASNVGQLLWSGIVPEARAPAVADRLFGEEMWSGWGVRTLSAAAGGYNPIGYHVGTVWPHDNALIAAGLARYGYRDQANRIAVAMLEAAEASGHRLPEVFAGYPRGESRFPVRYPTASNPQAWATGAPFLWLRLMLGLQVRDGGLAADPHLPEPLTRLDIRGLPALGRRFDVRIHPDGAEITPV